MPARRPLAGSTGFSLLELLLVTSIMATLSMVSIPLTAAALDEVRTAMAARYLEGRIMNARMTAIRRSTKIALRFEAVDDDYRYGEYWDGNGNGVRSAEIASGLDPEIARAEFLGSALTERRREPRQPATGRLLDVMDLANLLIEAESKSRVADGC